MCKTSRESGVESREFERRCSTWFSPDSRLLTSPLRVAVAQIDTTIGDFAGNAEKILALGRRAEREGTDLVLFPELAVCGYPPRDLVERNSFVEESEKTARRIARSICVL